MPLSAVTGAWGSIRLNITKRHVRDPPLAGIDHPDALTAGRRRRGCASVTHGGPGQHGASSRPALAGRGTPGQDINERARLRFSRISIARCADPGPLLRVCLGLSR
jgi:hypothetical protein